MTPQQWLDRLQAELAYSFQPGLTEEAEAAMGLFWAAATRAANISGRHDRPFGAPQTWKPGDLPKTRISTRIGY